MSHHRQLPTANDAVWVTCTPQKHPEVLVIVMFIAGKLKDKINRREASDVRDTSGNKHSQEISSSSRKSLECSAANQKAYMPDTHLQTGDRIVDAENLLKRCVKSAADSPDYRKKRESLLATEKGNAWYASAQARASAAEVKANKILFRIREHERIKHFANVPSEAVPPPETRDMGGRFLLGKRHIDSSKIFAIAQEMPKGAHLHLHFNAELAPEILLLWARRDAVKDTMYVRSTRPLTPDADFREAQIVFNVMPKDIPNGNIFSPDYRPEGWKEENSRAWMRWADFRSQFPTSGVTIFERNVEDLDDAECWAREKMIITKESSYADDQTLNGAWACFNIGTRAFKGLLNYEGAYRWYIGDAIESMIRDKVMYAELRPMLLDKTIPSNDGLTQLDHRAQMVLICEEVRKKQDELRATPGRSIDDFPFGIKLIYSTPRSIPRAMMQNELRDCIKLKLQFDDLICGFDLVGAEDRPNNIGYYADLLVAFTETCENLKIKIPFMFHAGETLLDTGGSHIPDNSNLYDSLLLNAKRIGHGYSLLKHPLLVEKYKAQKICLELCPISNELLHLCTNSRQHIFPELLAAGLHCTINADNPSLFNSSLSYEFYQIMVGDTRMNLHGWKQLAEWSFEHSCLNPADQAHGLAIFHDRWETFCQWIVDTYGDFADTLTEFR